MQNQGQSDNFPFNGITLTRSVEIIRVKEYLAKLFRSRVYLMSRVIFNFVSATATFSRHHNFGSRAPVVDDERAVSRG